MFTPSLPADEFSAPNALVCPRKMALLRPKMTRKQTCYHGNETTALRKLLLSLDTGVISTKRLLGFCFSTP